MKSTKRVLACGAVAALAMSLSSASAGATERFVSKTLSANVSSDTTLVTPMTRRVTGRITVKAGAKKIVVGIEAGSPRFERMVSGKLIKEGPTLRPVRIRSVGPTRRVISDGSSFGGFAQCDPSWSGLPLPHGGPSSYGVSRGLILQAHQSVTVEADFDVASDAPWVGTDYAPLFRLTPVERDIGDGTMLYPRGTRMLRKSVTLTAPKPVVSGPFAARIDILSAGDAKSKERGAVKGVLFPAEAGRTINFAAARWRMHSNAPPSLAPIGSVITAADGSFVLPVPMLSSKAVYSIVPSYPSQAGDLLADTACPFTFWGKASL